MHAYLMQLCTNMGCVMSVCACVHTCKCECVHVGDYIFLLGNIIVMHIFD